MSNKSGFSFDDTRSGSVKLSFSSKPFPFKDNRSHYFNIGTLTSSSSGSSPFTPKTEIRLSSGDSPSLMRYLFVVIYSLIFSSVPGGITIGGANISVTKPALLKAWTRTSGGIVSSA